MISPLVNPPPLNRLTRSLFISTLFTLFFISSSLTAHPEPIQANPIQASPAQASPTQASLAARHLHVSWKMAYDSKSRQRGLMNTAHLRSNEGLLMVFEEPGYPHIWALGLQIDIDVAFLDADHRIVSIQPLAAEPLQRQADRSDFKARQKLLSRALHPSTRCCYVIETARGWFKQSQIEVGDQLVWLPASPITHLIHLPQRKL